MPGLAPGYKVHPDGNRTQQESQSLDELFFSLGGPTSTRGMPNGLRALQARGWPPNHATHAWRVGSSTMALCNNHILKDRGTHFLKFRFVGSNGFLIILPLLLWLWFKLTCLGRLPSGRASASKPSCSRSCSTADDVS